MSHPVPHVTPEQAVAAAIAAASVLPAAPSLARMHSRARTAPQGHYLTLQVCGGAAFAGGLLLSEPSRYAGAAIHCGTLPFDAEVPVAPARLAGTPVFVAQGDQDRVIPAELLVRTWSYLLTESAAPAYARRDPGGHGITAQTLAELGGWIGERLDFLTRLPPVSPGPGSWPTLPGRCAAGRVPGAASR